MSFSGNMFTSRYRTSVVYDYSIVKKAVFYVFDKMPATSTQAKVQKTAYTYTPTMDNTFAAPLYVQINPNTMRLASGHRVANYKIKGQQQMSPDSEKLSEHFIPMDSWEKELDLELKYDMYDEHMIGTMDGLITARAEETSLWSKEATSVQKLTLLSNYQATKAVLFKWGPIEFFGRVESVDINYDTFSRFGYPLKCNASVKLQSEGARLKADGTVEEATERVTNGIKGYMTAINGLQKIEDGVLIAEIGATKALR